MKPGSIVIVNCINPKEQFWGILLNLDTAGVTVRGIDIRSFEDWTRQLSRTPDDHAIGLVTMFVPLFRVERIFLDERAGLVPSYCEHFERIVGREVREFLGEEPAGALS